MSKSGVSTGSASLAARRPSNLGVVVVSRQLSVPNILMVQSVSRWHRRRLGQWRLKLKLNSETTRRLYCYIRRRASAEA